MPKIEPVSSVVAWPQDEGVLGVVGVAPWATLEFCRSFYTLVDAQKDWHYPRILLDINTKLPSRGRHLQLGERDPSPYIAETIAELAAAGATVAVVVCNTAHILFDRWALGAPIPIISIVDAVVMEARHMGARRVVALVSESLVKHDLYGRKCEASGLSQYRLPENLQQIVYGFIEQIKVAGRLSQAGEEEVGALVTHLKSQQLDAVLLGCTELSILQHPLIEAGFSVIDSNRALAKAAYAKVRGGAITLQQD